MAIISHEQIIKGYYETVKHKYPELDAETFEKMCKAPFLFFREEIKSGRLPVINIKFLGKFQVFRSKIIKLINTTKEHYEKGWINEIEYEDKMNYLNNYLEQFSKTTPHANLSNPDVERTEKME